MEYVLYLASAAVSALTNAAGLGRRGGARSFLVVKLDHLGDVVTATPVLRALRAAHPGAPIDALVGSWAAPLLEGNPFVSRVLTYDAPRFLRPGSAAGDASPGAKSRARRAAPAPSSSLARLREVARGSYTDIVELRGDAWTLLLPLLCGAHRRVDRGTTRTAMWLRRHGLLGGGRDEPAHEVATNLAVVRPLLGDRAGTGAPEVVVTDAERERLRQRLASEGIDLARPTICMHPGAYWRPRAWRVERWASLADRLEERYPVQTLFLGGANEGDLEAALRVRSPGRRHHYLFGTLSLREVCVLLDRAALVIGNDSGLIHIAAACGTPVIGLYGPQLPSRFGPGSARSIALHHEIECCPCSQRICVRPEDPCVNLITVEEVLAAAGPILREVAP